ncbi:unnamed protein product [Boreogadus saida]
MPSSSQRIPPPDKRSQAQIEEAQKKMVTEVTEVVHVDDYVLLIPGSSRSLVAATRLRRSSGTSPSASANHKSLESSGKEPNTEPNTSPERLVPPAALGQPEVWWLTVGAMGALPCSHLFLSFS